MEAHDLRLWPRNAHGIQRNQVPAFITVHLAKVHEGLVSSCKRSGSQVINLATFGGEVREGQHLAQAGEARLPIGAYVVLTGIDGQREIGTMLEGTYPRAIHPNLCRDTAG